MAESSLPEACFFRHTIEVESHTSLKNTKRISFAGGRPYLRTDSKTKTAQAALVLHLQDRARRLLLDKPFGGAVLALWKLELTNFWTKSKPKRLNRKAGDISNLIQACEDALTKAGVIEDDSLIIEMHVVKIPSHRNAITVELFAQNTGG